MLSSVLESFNTQVAVPLSLLILVGLIALAWLIFLTVTTWRVLGYSRKLFGDTQKEDLKEILQDHIGRVSAVQIRISDLERLLGQMEHKSNRHISKVGVIRFNPFEDTGGDQSFVLALLDDSDDGVVVSSLHGRERSRIYAKPVKSGDATDYDFSEEEREAIRRARALGHK
jgi:hypothetical protein